MCSTVLNDVLGVLFFLHSLSLPRNNLHVFYKMHCMYACICFVYAIRKRVGWPMVTRQRKCQTKCLLVRINICVILCCVHCTVCNFNTLWKWIWIHKFITTLNHIKFVLFLLFEIELNRMNRKPKTQKLSQKSFIKFFIFIIINIFYTGHYNFFLN